MRLAFGSRPEDLTPPSAPASALLLRVGEEVLSSFESQFPYARELFHEVYDSDPIRTRYPMLFLTQRAPGHSDIAPACTSISPKPTAASARCASSRGNSFSGRLHKLPA